MRRLTEAQISTESFKEFYSDQIRPSLQMMSTDPETGTSTISSPSETLSIKTEKTQKTSKETIQSIPGEYQFPFDKFETKEKTSNESLKSFPREEQTARAYFEQYGEDLPDIIFSETEEEKKLSEERKTDEEKRLSEERKIDETIKQETMVKSEKNIQIKKKQKWEGVPKCYLCRCIIPEGLLGCPCGETTGNSEKYFSRFFELYLITQKILF